MAKKRRTYTPEFKAEAVKLVTEQGYSVAEAARSLGVHETLLRSWKQTLQAQGDQAFPGHGKLPPFEEELRRLHAENQRLRAERDILKKATALFAQEAIGPSASSKSTRTSAPCVCCATRSASRPLATRPGALAPPAPGSNGVTPCSWRSGPSMPSSRPATAARVFTPSWRLVDTTAA